MEKSSLSTKLMKASWLGSQQAVRRQGKISAISRQTIQATNQATGGQRLRGQMRWRWVCAGNLSHPY